MLTGWVRFANWRKPLGVCTCLVITVLLGCAAQPLTSIGVDRAGLREENIQRIAVLVFESPYDDPQAGSHISKLLEVNLLKTGLYRVAERGEIEKVLKERGFGAVSSSDRQTLRQLGELLQVDGIVFGGVSRYNRFNLGFTARLVSIKTGLVVWSISQTGGRIFRPLGQVAEETVRLSVEDLQTKIR
jgi:hypothetical protein